MKISVHSWFQFRFQPHSKTALLSLMKSTTRRGLLITTAAAVTGLFGFQIGRISDESTGGTSRAPLIGIASLTSDPYVRAIRESGGIPLVLPNADGSVERIEDYLDLLDGLLMPGGADIPPSEYDEEPHETVEPLDEDRFQFEKALGKAWIEKTDKPLLGICLGSQWINVLHGGSLVQDIPSEFGVSHRDISHPVALESDSRISGIFGETELEVNSLHHQAVKRVGDGLRIVGRSPDGVIEATETTDPDRFLIGVQWHPEKMMPDDAVQAKLLKAFVEAAAAARKSGSHFTLSQPLRFFFLLREKPNNRSALFITLWKLSVPVSRRWRKQNTSIAPRSTWRREPTFVTAPVFWDFF